MEEKGRFPYRFFVVTFAWSWLIWLPLVLAGAGIIPLGKHLFSAVIVPVTILGIFGPAAGAFYCLRASRQRCRSPVPARPAGSSFWLVGVAAPPLVLGGTAWLAWVLPDYGRAAPEDAPAFRMGLPTVSTGDDLPRRRTGRTGLARIHPGPAGGATGTWLGSLVVGVVGPCGTRRCFSYREPARFVPFAGFALL